MAADIVIENSPICLLYGLVLEVVSNQPPEPFLSFVEVPGRDGLVDLSEAGGLHYKNRQMSFKLHATENTLEAEGTLSQIKNWLHGREFDFSLSWDSEYIYHGRFAVSIEQPTAQKHQVINLSINAEPFKVKRGETVTATLDGLASHTSLPLRNVSPSLAHIVVTGSPVWIFKGALYSGKVDWCKLYEVGEHDEVMTGGSYSIVSPDDTSKTWSQTRSPQSVMDELFGETWAELGTNRSIDPPEPILWSAFSHLDSGASVSITYDRKEL